MLSMSKPILKVTVPCVLLLVLGCASFSQAKSPSKIPPFVYGTWRIYKFTEVGGHAGEKPDLAKKEIDRKISFGRRTMSYDNGFLFLDPPCRKVSYVLEVRTLRRNGVGEKGTLAWHGLNPAKSKQIQNLVVRCNSRPAYYFELTDNHQLAIYYDGWFFFLKKVSGQPADE
jgi:hypothetical protein